MLQFACRCYVTAATESTEWQPALLAAIHLAVGRQSLSNDHESRTIRVSHLRVLINWRICWRYLITISHMSYVNYARVYILRLAA